MKMRAVLSAIWLPAALCIIRHFDVVAPIGPHMYTKTLVKEFGIAKDGYVRINATLSNATSRVAFSLFSRLQWEDSRLTTATRQDGHCYMPAAVRFQSSGAHNLRRFDVAYSDLYTLQLTYCPRPSSQPGQAVPAAASNGDDAGDASDTVAGASLRVTGWVELANAKAKATTGGGQTEDEGTEVDHLPLGRRRSVDVAVLLLVLYVGLSMLWLKELLLLRGLGPWRRVLRTEQLLLLCGVVLGTKVFELLVQLEELMSVRRQGVESDLLSGVRVLAMSVAQMAFLGLLLLTSLGWQLVRPQLSAKEWRVLAITFSLYLVVVSVRSFCGDPCRAYELCSTSANRTCSASILTEYVIRLLIMLGIIVAMNYNITHLNTLVHDERWHAARSPATYARLKKLKALRWAFLVFLLFPTILLIIRITVFTWRFEWAAELLTELLYLGVYTYIGRAYRPSYGMRLQHVPAIIARHGVQLHAERGVSSDSSDSDEEDAHTGGANLGAANSPDAGQRNGPGGAGAAAMVVRQNEAVA